MKGWVVAGERKGERAERGREGGREGGGGVSGSGARGEGKR